MGHHILTRKDCEISLKYAHIFFQYLIMQTDKLTRVKHQTMTSLLRRRQKCQTH